MGTPPAAKPEGTTKGATQGKGSGKGTNVWGKGDGYPKDQAGNPNGSRRDIAGIRNERGNVVGLMPHPEHAVEQLTGPTTDGLPFFTSILTALVNA